jgi:hypothetical protein
VLGFSIMRRPISRLLPSLLLGACVLAPACKKSEAPVAHDRSIATTDRAAHVARRANQDLRASRGELGKAAAGEKAAEVGKDIGRLGTSDASFVAKRDLVVAQARTSLAAMDQKIAELETYRAAGKIKVLAKTDAALAALRDERGAAASALDDLALADPDTWDTRRVAIEKAYADLDSAYKDARDTMTVDTSTR